MSRPEKNSCVILTLTSKIKHYASKIFQNAFFILANALFYFYFTRLFGPFQIYSLTFFTLEQVKILMGIAFVGALAVFYGPAKGIISILLGEFLVQWKLPPVPTWWFLGLYPLFLLPLFFHKVEFCVPHYAKFSVKVGALASVGALFGVVGFFLLGMLNQIPLSELLPQGGTFALSSMITYVPIITVLAVLFARLRQPREIYSQTLTHHPWEERDHTISIHFGGLLMHFCTRCSGMVVGVISVLIISDLFQIAIAPEIALWLCIILPAPGLVIWSIQKWGFWTDKTPSRLVNGAALGCSIYMLTQTRPYILEMTLILVIYFVIFYAMMFGGTYYQRKKMLGEIEESLRLHPQNEEEKPIVPSETRPNPQ